MKFTGRKDERDDMSGEGTGHFSAERASGVEIPGGNGRRE